MFFVVFVVAGCIVYVLAVVVSFIVLCYALFVCNVCYLSVVLLYSCHQVKAQLQFNKYIYIYIYIYLIELLTSKG
jgi:hypothetical protein